MLKLWSICRNAFVQTIRQPIYLILIMLTFGAMVLQLALAGYSMGVDYQEGDLQMLVEFGLSMLLFAGLLLAVFSASSTLTREIEDRTVLTVVSKPVSRATVVLGSFLGVLGAVLMGLYLCSLAYLMTVRQGTFSAAADPNDWPVIILGCGAVVLALLAAGVGNMMFSWTFTSTFVMALAVLLTVAMGIVTFVGIPSWASDNNPDFHWYSWQAVPPGYRQPPKAEHGVVRVVTRPGITFADIEKQALDQGYKIISRDDTHREHKLQFPSHMTHETAIAALSAFRGVQEATVSVPAPRITAALLQRVLLVAMGVVAITAVAVAVSTRLNQVATLLACLGLAIAGGLHPFLFGDSGLPALQYVGWLVPKMSYAYPPESTALQRSVPLEYLGLTAVYYLLYAAGALAAGVALFQTRGLEAGTASEAPGPVNVLAMAGRAAAVVAAGAALLLATSPRYFSATSFMAAGGLVALAVGMWLLWGFYGRGARWAWWAVLTLSAGGVAATASLAMAHAELEPTALVIVAGASAAAGIITLLPRTRWHFGWSRRTGRKSALAAMPAGAE
jgi:ABC-type transport system involved in multi-copper enzyme maturation permease subunit